MKSDIESFLLKEGLTAVHVSNLMEQIGFLQNLRDGTFSLRQARKLDLATIAKTLNCWPRLSVSEDQLQPISLNELPMRDDMETCDEYMIRIGMEGGLTSLADDVDRELTLPKNNQHMLRSISELVSPAGAEVQMDEYICTKYPVLDEWKLEDEKSVISELLNTLRSLCSLNLYYAIRGNVEGQRQSAALLEVCSYCWPLLRKKSGMWYVFCD